MNKLTKKLYFNLLLLASLTMGCSGDVESPIPEWPVHLELNLTTTYPNFKGPNQAFTFEKRILETDRIGFAGIIVYNGFDNNYYAFDMCCPYEIKQTVKVYPNDLGQAVCKGCGTVYDISYGIGHPISGPSKELLKRYRVTLSNQVLYITR